MLVGIIYFFLSPSPHFVSVKSHKWPVKPGPSFFDCISLTTCNYDLLCSFTNFTSCSNFPSLYRILPHQVSSWVFQLDCKQLKMAVLNKLGHIFFYWRYNPLWVCSLQPSSGATASSRTRFLDHTQRHATVGRTPLDEWSVRRRDLYLTTHNTHNRQISMPQVGFEPTIAAGERP